MKISIFQNLGQQLKLARQARKLTQPELASRLGRDRARISELERDLLNARLGRDRLTLFAEICDALDLVPVLVPRNQATQVQQQIAIHKGSHTAFSKPSSTFDEVFVDLSDED